MAVNNDIYLGVGNISFESGLGKYYQNLKPAIYHFEHNSLGIFDKNGIPCIVEGNNCCYSIVYIIQYALIQHEFIMDGNEAEMRKEILMKCITWLNEKSEIFKDSIVWRSEQNKSYGLEKGWVSAMYQGQAISLYLRAYQLFNNEKFFEIAKEAFKFLQYDYNDGGAKRMDECGYLWFEEYPTKTPSFVLNGFIYTIFGVLDLYRVTKNEKALEIFNECIKTLEYNLHKYDKWYWSVYDQQKQELVSYYYHKNIHIPLMEILYKLTQNEIFNHYQTKWKKQLNSKICYILVQIMYRIQPIIKKLYQ